MNYFIKYKFFFNSLMEVKMTIADFGKKSYLCFLYIIHDL